MNTLCPQCGRLRNQAIPRPERLCRTCSSRTSEMRAMRQRLGIGRKQTEIAKEKIRVAQLGRFGSASSGWKGGRYTEGGYVKVKLIPSDFFLSMANKERYVLEHRLIMAQSLGRCLHRWEIIHHRNHIRSDNRLENLQLVSDDKHKQITILENRIAWLEDKMESQAKELRLLRGSLKTHADHSNLRETSPGLA